MHVFRTLNITVQARRSESVPGNWVIHWPHGEIEIRTDKEFRAVFRPATTWSRDYLARKPQEESRTPR
jgi:hypothetical protein